MIYEVIWQSTIAGLATVFGAFIVVALGHPGERILASLLGFAGGVMTAVVTLDLIPSALNYGNVTIACCGFILGLVLMFLLDSLFSVIPGFKSGPDTKGRSRFLKMGYLIAVGIALHDLPEGIAIAAGHSLKESLGVLIALSIGFHNIPEGMATAAPLTMGGKSKKSIIATCFIISLFTPLGACLGLMLAALSGSFISGLLAMAGGAMAFIVKNELIPVSCRRHPNYARLGFFQGALLILALSLMHYS